MKLIDCVDMLTNVRVVDSHFCTVYEGDPKGMIDYFTNYEKTLDYLNCIIEDKVFRDNEVIIYLGKRICLDDNRARNIFNYLLNICNAFNDNLNDVNCNYNLNELFRGEYMGIELVSSCFGYDVSVNHRNWIFNSPIIYISVSKNGSILFERSL